MRIAQITNGYRPTNGGQEILIDLMNRTFRGFGYLVDTFQLDNAWPDEEGLVKVKDLFPFVRSGERSKLAWSLLLSNYDLQRYDVVIFHYAISWLAFAYLRNAIVFSHGIEWNETKRTVKRFLKERISLLASRRAPSVFTIANDKNYLRFILGAQYRDPEGYSSLTKGIWYLPNPVDIDRFRSALPIPIVQALRPVLLPRNIVFERGIHLAIKAFAKLTNDFPDMHLLVVGELWFTKDNKYGQYLSSLIRQLKLQGKVIFVGNVPWEEMANYYRSAVVTLVPTLAGEGTSLSALESMASGTPVVSTSVGGLAELPSLKAEATPESLYEKLRYVIDNREIIALKQFKEVAENFNIDKWRHTLQNILKCFAETRRVD